MPIFLIPFLIAHGVQARNTKKLAHIEEQRLAIEQQEYALHLQEYNERHHGKAPRAILVPGTPWQKKHAK